MNKFICIRCRRELPLSERREFDGHDYCRICLNATTAVCHICGTRFALTQNHGTIEAPLCGECLNNHNHAGIRDYCFKPRPIFYGKGPRYFGVELEIDDGGESSSNANQLMAVANADAEYIYCKHDGSLDDGIEIVSHPASLDYHMNVIPWCDVIEEARSLDYLSHKAGTCGLHIHVSRAAFGTTEQRQDAVIARVLYFFEKHWEELLKFSRRTQSQLNEWAARYGYRAEPKEILDDAKKRNHRSRYTAVNLTNTDTVEFRMFRGTLKVNTFLATLQLLDRICDVAISLSAREAKRIEIDSGEIIKIDRAGAITRGSFNDALLYAAHLPCRYPCYTVPVRRRFDRNALRELKAVAGSFGYAPEMIDRMIERGFRPEEIEEYLNEL